MGSVFKALIVIAGLWASVELFTMGPSHAFGGLFAGFFAAQPADTPARSTAQRAGDKVQRSQDETEARRERMLGSKAVGKRTPAQNVVAASA